MSGYRNLALGGLLTLATLSGVAQERAGPVEEVLVQGIRGCGSWPIAHNDIRICEYAELSSDAIPAVMDLRKRLLSKCLACVDDACTTRRFPRARKEDERLCRRVFWTPTRIGPVVLTDPTAELLDVSFTYSISRRGRIDNIRITFLEGGYSRREAQHLIEAGAARTRYAPVVIDNVEYEITGLEDHYVLEE